MSREKKLFNEWQNALKDIPKYAQELKDIENDEQEIKDRFYTDLNFGTAGLRGIMGLGTNRMNVYTVGRATQGLANYAINSSESPSIAVAYDSRINSKDFADHTASILAANGIKVHLYPRLAPTPALAYAVRELDCDFGVVITASHNPAEYNGYKVFGSDGCQIDDDVAEDVFEQIKATDTFTGVKTLPLEEAVKQNLLVYIDESLTDRYIKQVLSEALQPEVCKQADLSVVYTPLNGTGNLYVRRVLDELSVDPVYIVPEQEHPDGNFPTAPYPNPEFPEALKLGLALSEQKKVDVLLATDPDADRVAISVRHNDEYQILSGNEIGILLLDYIASTRKKMGTLPENPIAIRSLVSTNLTDYVALDYGVVVKDVLTGFKHIGEVIAQLEDAGEIERFIFGFEEANGYLIGTHVRDKDAVVTSVLLAEMLSYFKLEGKTAVDRLEEIYQKHGYYSYMAQNLTFKGAQGMTDMKNIMDELRHNPPKEVVGRKVVSYLDYWTSIRTEEGEKYEIDTRPSNVLEYRLEDDCKVIIRPSGTEPKLKLYYSLKAETPESLEALEKEYAHASVELAGVEA